MLRLSAGPDSDCSNRNDIGSVSPDRPDPAEDIAVNNQQGNMDSGPSTQEDNDDTVPTASGKTKTAPIPLFRQITTRSAGFGISGPIPHDAQSDPAEGWAGAEIVGPDTAQHHIMEDADNVPGDWVDEMDPITPPRSGKRPSTHFSPLSPRPTGTKQKRRIITDDDLAAIEAAKLLIGTRGSRRIRRRR